MSLPNIQVKSCKFYIKLRFLNQYCFTGYVCKLEKLYLVSHVGEFYTSRNNCDLQYTFHLVKLILILAHILFPLSIRIPNILDSHCILFHTIT